MSTLDLARGRRATVIRPVTGLLPLRARELRGYRELFLFLVWRDIKVRYAQTLLGGAWMFFQPLALLLVYTFAFAHLAKVNIPGTPYVLFALAGLTLWIFLSRAVLLGSESLVSNMSLVTKTSCPRIIIPLASVVAVFADFLVALVIFLMFAAAYGRAPSWRFAFVPLLLALAFLLALGLSLLLSPINVRYRDVNQALPFLIQLWFFLSPVAYLLQTPGRSLETIIQAANPAVGMILAFRWALLATPPPHGLLAASFLISLAFFGAGLVHFSRQQHTIADDV